MKFFFLLSFLMIGNVTYANSCSKAVEDKINKIVSKQNENSGVLEVRYQGRLSNLAFGTYPLDQFETYYVTVSDESGGSVWHVVAQNKTCNIISTKELLSF